MAVPPKSDPRWRRFVTSGGDYSFQHLATKIAYSRIRRLVAQGGEASIAEAIESMHEFFSKNGRIAADDLPNVLG